MSSSTLPGAGQPFPPDLGAIAGAHQLGAFVAPFRPDPLRIKTVWTVVLIVGGVLSVAVLFTDAWPIGLLPLFFVALGGIRFLQGRIRLRNPRRVLLFERGFIHVDPAKAATVYRWDVITAVYQHITNHYYNGVKGRTTHVYTVDGPPGRLVLNDFWEHIVALGQTIEQEVTNVQVPAALAWIRQGNAVRFGDISLHFNGLISDKHGMLPWEQIEKVQVQNGYVGVSKAGKWLSWSTTPFSQTPNAFVFLSLVQILRPGLLR
jgi:hypothetical protein